VLTTIQAFDKFRQRLELSDTEQQDAANRQAEVRECIRESFDIKTDFLSGSYRRHTKTKPLKDVDVMFVLGEKEKWRRDKPPIATLQAFEKCLKTKYTEHGQVEIGRRSVTVEFEKDYYTDDHEGKVLSIDVVPAFECGGGDYEIPDKITGKWIKTNPEEHREQATAKNKELDGRWVPLVKMAKVRGRLVRALPRRGRCGRREAELASPGHRVGAQSHARSRDRARRVDRRRDRARDPWRHREGWAAAPLAGDDLGPRVELGRGRRAGADRLPALASARKPRHPGDATAGGR
jgi:Second Messenger Oligonucleotide or Dinucleotide Synthetase domain